MFFKIVTLLFGLAIAWQLVDLWQAGKNLTKGFSPEKLAVHRSKVATLGCLTLVAVALVELQIRISPDPYSSHWLLQAFHFLIVTMLVIVFSVMVLRFTGLRSPLVHKYLARAFYWLWAMTIGTGTVMLYQLPT